MCAQGISHNLGLKKAIERSAREALFSSRLFQIVRDAYQHVFAREKLASRKTMLGFYANFISRGDLVFDVGANVGDYTDAFLTLGAQVVAVEPNPICCQRLKAVARGRSLAIENCAAGDVNCTLPMHFCSETTLSTLSNSWRSTATTSSLHQGNTWSEPVEVRVKTLDSLAAKYGVPSFIKIDVEGFEDRVMAGMSFAPTALSFEFHFQLLDLARKCLRNPTLGQEYLYNYLIGMNLQLELRQWVPAGEIEKALAQTIPLAEFGEIFCTKA